MAKKKTVFSKAALALIAEKIPGDLKPYAALIMPVLGEMIDVQGWDPVREFLFAYKGANRSWDRKLMRNMNVKQRIKWRQIMSDKRIAELEEYKIMRMRSTALRRILIQRIMTEAIEIVIGAL